MRAQCGGLTALRFKTHAWIDENMRARWHGPRWPDFVLAERQDGGFGRPRSGFDAGIAARLAPP
jgi:hypothetical protein